MGNRTASSHEESKCPKTHPLLSNTQCCPTKKKCLLIDRYPIMSPRMANIQNNTIYSTKFTKRILTCFFGTPNDANPHENLRVRWSNESKRYLGGKPQLLLQLKSRLFFNLMKSHEIPIPSLKSSCALSCSSFPRPFIPKDQDALHTEGPRRPAEGRPYG